MILRTVDGRVAMSGKELAVAIPESGEARYEVSPGTIGGRLDVLIPEGQSVGGRVILGVPDGQGEFDELVITSPRTLEVDASGRVALTLSEYVQVGGALSAVAEKLGEFEARLSALEHLVTPEAPETMPGPSGEEE